MTGIKRVAILGAGAIGAIFAAKFSQADGFSTLLVARGARRDRLERDGLVVNRRPFQLPVLDPSQVSQPADLIIVALKHHHLPGAVHDLKHIVSTDTTIISVMNGLDSEETIGTIYGMDKVLYAIIVGIDAVRQGNQVTYTNLGKVIFGEARNDGLSARVRRLQEAFDRAGVPYETPADMMRMLWWKFMINVGMNQASAVMRAPYGTFQASLEAQALMEALMHEVVELAEPAGVDLSPDDVNAWYPFLNAVSPQAKTSMLQDIEAGRKTEVEMFAGKVVELGRSFGIATPVNWTVHQIIQVLEKA